MKVTLHITDKRNVGVYGAFQPSKTETYTVAELDGELTREATIGMLRAIAASLDDRDCAP